MQAFCLAAGLGKRLRPITGYIPKPLVPVLGRPNLGWILDKVMEVGIERVVLNTHHLYEKIEDFVISQYPNCVISRENYLLGTGGGLKFAFGNFHKVHPIMIVNTDIVFEFPLDLLIEYHQENHCIATLLLTDHPPQNTVCVEGDLVKGFSKGADNTLCFTGVSVVEPEIMEYCPSEYPFSLIDIFKNCLSHKRCIAYVRGESLFPGFFWYDIGTPNGYLQCHERLLQEKGLTKNGHWNWIADGAKIAEGARLTRCIVWEDTVIAHPGHYEDSIFTPYGVLNAKD